MKLLFENWRQYLNEEEDNKAIIRKLGNEAIVQDYKDIIADIKNNKISSDQFNLIRIKWLNSYTQGESRRAWTQPQGFLRRSVPSIKKKEIAIQRELQKTSAGDLPLSDFMNVVDKRMQKITDDYYEENILGPIKDRILNIKFRYGKISPDSLAHYRESDRYITIPKKEKTTQSTASHEIGHPIDWAPGSVWKREGGDLRWAWKQSKADKSRLEVIFPFLEKEGDDDDPIKKRKHWQKRGEIYTDLLNVRVWLQRPLNARDILKIQKGYKLCRTNKLNIRWLHPSKKCDNVVYEPDDLAHALNAVDPDDISRGKPTSGQKWKAHILNTISKAPSIKSTKKSKGYA